MGSINLLDYINKVSNSMENYLKLGNRKLIKIDNDFSFDFESLTLDYDNSFLINFGHVDVFKGKNKIARIMFQCDEKIELISCDDLLENFPVLNASVLKNALSEHITFYCIKNASMVVKNALKEKLKVDDVCIEKCARDPEEYFQYAVHIKASTDDNFFLMCKYESLAAIGRGMISLDEF